MRHYWDRIMRRCIHLFIAGFLANAMMILLALPTYAQDEGDYAGNGDDYYANSYGPQDNGYSKYDRPYSAYSFSTREKSDGGYDKAGHYSDRGGYNGDGYNGNGNGSDAYAYGYGEGYRKKARWRKACIFGPIRYKKICDYEPPRCWKEKECYVIYGRKYCRKFTKCSDGWKSCRWVKKRSYYPEDSYCGGHY
jgi:hypothetical protein